MFGLQFQSRRLVAIALAVATVCALAPVLSFAQDAPSVTRGRKYKSPPQTARIEVVVTRASTGKPVDNASVIFHPLTNGRNSGNMELKTNDDGKAMMDLLELGSSVRLQIIAPGFQTYGEDYKVDKESMSIEVKLKRPTEQYSIYKKGEGVTPAKPDASSDAKPKDDKPKEPAPPK